MFLKNKLLSLRCLVLPISLISTIALAEEKPIKYPGLNSTQIGVQSITYSETNANFAGLGDLSTEVEATNTILFASSYTHLYDNFGFWLNTQSSINKEIVQDEWSVEGYGAVQSNSNKLDVSDLTALGVYHLEREYFVTFGVQLKSLKFVRANFQGIGDFARLNTDIRNSDQYFQDPNPPQISTQRLAIEEDQTYINGVIGINYNSAFAAKKRPLNFHAGANFSTSMYTIAQNSDIQSTYGIDSIEDSFHGYELRINSGMSYEFKKGLAVTFNANYVLQKADEMSTTFVDDGIERTAAIPEIEYTSLQFTLGLLWIN